MFKLTQIAGSGSAENLLTLDPLIEGSIHSILVDNTTGSAATVGFEIGGVEFNYSASDAVTTVLDVKINLPAGSAVNVTAPTGVKVVASYVEMALDAATALTTVQQITATAIQDVDDVTVAAIDQVSQILASVPEGTINDSITSGTSTWSSNKIAEEINNNSVDIEEVLPDFEGNAGKALIVNGAEDGVLWGTVSVDDYKIGDIIITSREKPDNFLLANGQRYLDSAYPQLSALSPEIVDGSFWTRISPTNISGTTPAFLARNGNNLVTITSPYTNNSQAFYSSNGGTSWTGVSHPAGNVRGHSITNQGSTFVAHVGTHIVRSTNNGQSWTSVQTGVASLNNTSTAIESDVSGTFLLASGSQVWRSTNSGGTWVQLNDLPGGFSASNGSLVSNGSGVWVLSGSSTNTILRSVDNGGNWSQITITPINYTNGKIGYSNGVWFFATSPAVPRVYRSTDSITWVEMEELSGVVPAFSIPNTFQKIRSDGNGMWSIPFTPSSGILFNDDGELILAYNDVAYSDSMLITGSVLDYVNVDEGVFGAMTTQPGAQNVYIRNDNTKVGTFLVPNISTTSNLVTNNTTPVAFIKAEDLE